MYHELCNVNVYLYYHFQWLQNIYHNLFSKISITDRQDFCEQEGLLKKSKMRYLCIYLCGTPLSFSQNKFWIKEEAFLKCLAHVGKLSSREFIFTYASNNSVQEYIFLYTLLLLMSSFKFLFLAKQVENNSILHQYKSFQFNSKMVLFLLYLTTGYCS